ncbi:AAA family ATPase [Erwinia sp. 9145]|uniref:AAA family ATPase n=1 Tax=Erwinia sp. 9145 TaxID=1500895 RepID=UPI00054FB9A4|nr:AAA family ATPase [Erwinia sp. 9145]
MIVGLFLRYFKIYSGTNYIPLSSGDNFCGIIGNNGIGKSSVLEALDCLLNNKTWNVNAGFRKASHSTSLPHIVPLYLIKRDDIPDELSNKAQELNDLVLNFNDKSAGITITPTTRYLYASFSAHIKKIRRNLDLDDYYLIPIGVNKEGALHLSILNSKLLAELICCEMDEDSKVSEKEINQRYGELNVLLKNKHQYIYIPKDIDPESFTKLETTEIQKLMGESLEEIIKDKIKDETIDRINNDLTSFISEIETELVDYSYRMSGGKQFRLKRRDVYNLIIEAFFKVRKINKKKSSTWIEISALSSGEKQRAIIDIAYGFLTNHNQNGKDLIIALDEPESSLHMSACFEQFEKLYKISKNCKQLIFTSHWYGYLPTIESGCTTSIIEKESGEHHFELLDLESYREEIKQKVKGANIKLPYDIRLKSINDLIQSIISSTISDPHYNWLICEGTTEKKYLSYYLSELVRMHRLRIIPVGGAVEVKKIYKYLEASHEDIKRDMKGKVFLLSDTDAELVSYETIKSNVIYCKRLINHSSLNETQLVDMESIKVSPATEIEHCLNGNSFLKALNGFIPDHPYLQGLVQGKSSNGNESSYFALNLTPKDNQLLDNFFNSDGMKYAFAKAYLMEEDFSTTPMPPWISEISTFFTDS